MKIWDVIVVGAGIIGLSLALDLRRRGASVLIIDRTEPGREASWAAAGMVAHCDPHLPSELQPLAVVSASIYPEYVHEIQDESQHRIDFRQQGTIAYFPEGQRPLLEGCTEILDEPALFALEPRLTFRPNGWFMPETSVDPRSLLAALVKAARHRGVDFVSGSPAVEVELSGGRTSGVRTEKAQYKAAVAVNCAGAWSRDIAPLHLPTLPVKGHMLSVVFQHNLPSATSMHEPLVSHVVRAPEVYIVPRSDGRLVIGSTAEDAGFDKRVDTDTIQRLHQSAANLVPDIGEARMLEAWTGLRPGTPDDLPVLGPTRIPGYFAATGHFRDGIMLAPITARIMSSLIVDGTTPYDLAAFLPSRFS